MYNYTSRPPPGTEDKTKQPAPLYSLRFLASDKGKLPKPLWAAPSPPLLFCHLLYPRSTRLLQALYFGVFQVM